MAENINDRQRSNWLKLRHKPYADPEMREALETLAEQIGHARMRLPTVTSAGPPLTPKPADQGAGAGVPKPGTVFRDIEAPRCPEMVVIRPGEFMMGSTEAEREWALAQGAEREWVEWEKPQHPVRIGYSLAVGRYPVTFEQYDHFCSETGRDQPKDRGWGRGRRPVINVSWDDAKAYVDWLAAQTREPYRLLSEAEWEYACRAGTTTRFWWGDEITPKKANYGRKLGKTSEVGNYPASRFGLQDMHGNVWEWVEDCWHDSYAGAPEDGGARLQGNSRRPMLRGGSWYDYPWFLRSADRNWDDSDDRGNNIGFRVATTFLTS